MDVHVINLDRNERRLSAFTATNRCLKNIVRFHAIDGGASPRAQLLADGIFSTQMPAYSDGAVGCALSHLSLWRKAAAQSEALTIAEDDAIFNLHFEAEASALIRSLPPDWDIILWGWNFDSILLFDFLPGVSPCVAAFSEEEMRQQAAIFQELRVKPRAYRLRKAFGSLAYTVSPQGARKLLRHCVPIREMDFYCPGLDRIVTNAGIDVMMNALYPEIDAFVSFPPLAVSKNEKTISTVSQEEDESAEAHIRQAAILQARGQFHDAIERYRRALDIDRTNAVIYNNLGVAILGAQGTPGDAAACFEQALALKPDYAEAHHNLAHIFRAQGRLDDAADHGQRALALKPDYAEAHYNLGNVFGDQGKLDDAVGCYERALALKPDYADAHTNLTITLRDQGRLEDAMSCCQRALALYPDSAVVNFSDAYFRLLTGDFVNGWPKYEWRWRTKEVKPHGLAAPMWDGKDLGGRTILLHCEQGLGDSIQSIRFARFVKDKGATVLLSCPASLARLFRSAAGVDGIFPDGHGLPGYHVHAPLMSVPGLFHTALDTIPADVPYLQADPAQVDVWRDRLAGYPGFRVGISWRGSPTHDCQRLMTSAQFAEFLNVPEISVISLQKDGTPEEMETLSHIPGPFLNSGPLQEDFSDAAALIANLDLVISVDTSVCHLAGALAASVWTLIPFAPDWRWLLRREDSPWYPTMRLFRQPKIGDWQSVVERVRTALCRGPVIEDRTDCVIG
jgi:tetratricopeptide (TPR) repeat protein